MTEKMQASVPLGLCAMMPNTNNVAEQQPCDVFYGIPVHDIFCFGLCFLTPRIFRHHRVIRAVMPYIVSSREATGTDTLPVGTDFPVCRNFTSIRWSPSVRKSGNDVGSPSSVVS